MAVRKYSNEERQNVSSELRGNVLPKPEREIVQEFIPVTITTLEGEVFEIAETPANLGRATALASEQTLRKILITRRRMRRGGISAGLHSPDLRLRP